MFVIDVRARHLETRDIEVEANQRRDRVPRNIFKVGNKKQFIRVSLGSLTAANQTVS